jgi:hypothetical protein
VNPYALLDLPFKNGSSPATTIATPDATPPAPAVPVNE